MTSTDFAYLLQSHRLANLCLANRRLEALSPHYTSVASKLDSVEESVSTCC